MYNIRMPQNNEFRFTFSLPLAVSAVQLSLSLLLHSKAEVLQCFCSSPKWPVQPKFKNISFHVIRILGSKKECTSEMLMRLNRADPWQKVKTIKM